MPKDIIVCLTFTPTGKNFELNLKIKIKNSIPRNFIQYHNLVYHLLNIMLLSVTIDYIRTHILISFSGY